MITIFLSKFRNIVRRHAVPLLLFVLLALLIESPLIAFPRFAGNEYQGINIAHFGTDEHYYLVRASEVVDGNGLGNPFLAMNKDMPDPTVSYVDWFLTAPVRILGLEEKVDIVNYYNILNFLGIVATLIFMYAFAYGLSGSRLLSAAAAIFAIGGYSIIYHKWLFYTDFNIYGRSFIPYASSVPFLAFLLAAYRAAVRKMHLWYVIVAGGLFGILWHDYLYAWSYSLVFLGMLFLVYATQRKWPEAVRVASISLIGIVLGLPAFLSIVRQHIFGDSDTIAYFYFIAPTHMPVWSWVGAVSAIVWGLFAYYRRGNEATPFMLAIILAGWITLNQQVITGRELDLGHYYWYFVVPLGVIIGSFMVWRLLEVQRWIPVVRARLLFCVLLIALAFVNTIGGQYRSFFTTTDVKLHEQLYAPILADLKTLPSGTVFADPAGNTYSYLVPIYTKDDLYFARGGLVYYMPFDRIKDTLLISLFLNTNSRHDIRSFLERELAANYDNAYTQLLGDIEGYDLYQSSGLDFRSHTARMKNPDASLSRVRKDVLDQLEHEYKESFSTGIQVREKLASDDVKYIIWDKSLHPTWNPAAIPGLKVLDDRGEIVLYSLE